MKDVWKLVVSLFALLLDQRSREEDVDNIVRTSVLELQLLVDLFETHLALRLESTDYSRGRLFKALSSVRNGSFSEDEVRSASRTRNEKKRKRDQKLTRQRFSRS